MAQLAAYSSLPLTYAMQRREKVTVVVANPVMLRCIWNLGQSVRVSRRFLKRERRGRSAEISRKLAQGPG